MLANLRLKCDIYLSSVIGIQIMAWGVVLEGLLAGKNRNYKCFRHDAFQEIFQSKNILLRSRVQKFPA